MSLHNTQVQEWTHSLRYMTAVGASIATLILVPTAPLVVPIPKPSIRQEDIKVITTIPDGNVDLRTIHVSTSQGINTGVYFMTDALDYNEDLQKNNLPQMVREISGLPVDMLADLVGVSRNAYHKWLASGGVKSEHIAQLTTLFDAFQTLQNLHIPNLRAFLESAGPSGRPLDLLASGDIHAVVGLALRSPSQSRASVALSKEARQASGLPGWVRPAKKLNWNIPRLTGSDREDALDLLSPERQSEETFVIDDSDEDH